jgi:hypothetical protein
MHKGRTPILKLSKDSLSICKAKKLTAKKPIFAPSALKLSKRPKNFPKHFNQKGEN